ncbi:hypothetical protein QVD17_36701 [Tagetes erecta]|uniref:Uncharacterized protein n=1 Tax=Tagetes erecta TaxID=13708 RepID=A0AAD8JV52_TARER|nr:hypothetical protein QVD17_36701 [Tagetes erecta]
MQSPAASSTFSTIHTDLHSPSHLSTSVASWLLDFPEQLNVTPLDKAKTMTILSVAYAEVTKSEAPIVAGLTAAATSSSFCCCLVELHTPKVAAVIYDFRFRHRYVARDFVIFEQI